MTVSTTLDELERLARAASGDEWRVVPYGDGDSLVIHHSDLGRICFMATPGDSPGAMERIEANAAFIVAAKRDVLSLITRIRAKDEALRQAAGQFRHYEQLHDAKGTEDGRQKAIVNSMFAEVCETALLTESPS